MKRFWKDLRNHEISNIYVILVLRQTFLSVENRKCVHVWIIFTLLNSRFNDGVSMDSTLLLFISTPNFPSQPLSFVFPRKEWNDCSTISPNAHVVLFVAKTFHRIHFRLRKLCILLLRSAPIAEIVLLPLVFVYIRQKPFRHHVHWKIVDGIVRNGRRHTNREHD